MAHSRSSQRGSPSDLSESLRGNIEALRRRREEELASAGIQERLADAITTFTGSMGFIYAHVALYGAWMTVNLLPKLPHFDLTFVVLAMVASIGAIFLSTFVLISQNRAKAAADKRDDLDLHINLLTEHELTKLIMLVATIAKSSQYSIRGRALEERQHCCPLRRGTGLFILLVTSGWLRHC